MQDISATRASTLWIMLLTLASTATTLVFACATPFPALAALAAVHMRRSDGVLLMLAAWVASQGVGFCLKGYPLETSTILSGVSIGTAAIVSVLAASASVSALKAQPLAVRLVGAYLGGFVAFKLAFVAWSLAFGGVDSGLTAEIVLRQFVRNAAILGGLYALYRGLIAAGLPAAPAAPAAA